MNDLDRQQARPGPRPTIGFLIDTLFDAFEEAIWDGVMAEAAEADVHVLAFVGGAFVDRRQGQNGIYDLIHPENVDGLVAISGSLGNWISTEALAQRYRAFAPIPMVSLSKVVPGMPNLLLDNEAGLAALIDHLIDVHGRRRIAFVRGPTTSDDAEVRFRVYRDRLAAHGLPYDPQRVCQGDFDRASGIAAVQALLERGVEFDALVAANDYMALYAMQELLHRGRRVPEDVAVAGFDDIAEAAAASPALTTVHQPLEDMGREAVRSLLALLRGEELPACRRLAARPVLRGSCGCDPARPTSTPIATGPVRADELPAHVAAAFPNLGPELHQERWAEELAGALLDRARLEATLERLVEQGLARGVRAVAWYPVLQTAFDAVRQLPAPPPAEALAGLEAAALVAVGVAAERALTSSRTRRQDEFKTLRRLFMPTDLDPEEVKRVLLDELPTLGIRAFFLARFTDGSAERAALTLHFDFDEVATIDPAAEFPARQLLPGRLDPARRHAFAVLPIHTRRERLGFALCHLSNVWAPAYEALTYQISAAVKVTSLLDEVRGHAAALEVKVADRTRQLQAAQQQLVEAAHQAGMAEIAIGLMHNVGNLLNSVNVSAETIAGIAASPHLTGMEKANALLHGDGDPRRFLAEDPRGALLPDYYDRLLAELRQQRDRIGAEVRTVLQNGSLIRDTIQTLQDHARQGRYGLREEVDLPAVVETALKIQEPNLLQHGIAVERDLRPLPPLLTERARLIHVVVNLVKNAVEAMQGTPEANRRLAVRTWAPGPGRCAIAVADSGVGIPPENLDRIFSYGFTTKPDGHGFGLHTSANFMAQLGGRIAATSDGPGRGAVFTVELGGR